MDKRLCRGCEDRYTDEDEVYCAVCWAAIEEQGRYWAGGHYPPAEDSPSYRSDMLDAGRGALLR